MYAVNTLVRHIFNRASDFCSCFYAIFVGPDDRV